MCCVLRGMGASGLRGAAVSAKVELRKWNHDAANPCHAFLHLVGEDARGEKHHLTLEVEFRPPYKPWVIRRGSDFSVRLEAR